MFGGTVAKIEASGIKIGPLRPGLGLWVQYRASGAKIGSSGVLIGGHGAKIGGSGAKIWGKDPGQ